MEHTLPESHLELLQGIFKELVIARDPDATFEISMTEEEIAETLEQGRT